MRHDRLSTLDSISGNVKVDLDTLIHERSVEEQLEQAKKTLPGLYIAYMRYLRKDEKIEECMEMFKKYRYDQK